MQIFVKIKCLLLFVGGNWWNFLIVLETAEDQTIPEKNQVMRSENVLRDISHNFPA